ncbi:MAG: trypsin-like serine protease [Bryobacterales bacterium]
MATLIAALLCVANAGMIRHDVPQSLYRDLAKQSDFVSVGRYSDSPDSNDYAAGVLVAPRWVLTAAHFVGETSFWTFGEQQFRGIRVIRHPKLERGATETQWTGWDMALVELDRPVTHIKPAERYRGCADVSQARVAPVQHGGFRSADAEPPVCTGGSVSVAGQSSFTRRGVESVPSGFW